jgi:hypothetical protein
METPTFEVVGDTVSMATDAPGEWLVSDRLVDLTDWR